MTIPDPVDERSPNVLDRILSALDAACGDYPAPGSAGACPRTDAGYWAMHRAADIVDEIIAEYRTSEPVESVEWAMDRGRPGVTIDPSKPRCEAYSPTGGERCVLNADHTGMHEVILASRYKWAISGMGMTLTTASPL